VILHTGTPLPLRPHLLFAETDGSTIEPPETRKLLIMAENGPFFKKGTY